MIDFTRAFSSAWERMVIILFQPFDLGKWFVIGFSAFLAGFLSGGNGFNSSYRQNFDQQDKTTYNVPIHQLQSGAAQFLAGHTFNFLMLLAAGIFVFGIALVVLIYWLGARGQFLFLDNIVRNRAAIAWPWQVYARPANGVFFAYLIFMAAGFGIVILLVVPAVLLYLPFFSHPQWPPTGVLFPLIVLALVYVAVTLVFGGIIFIFREWGIPLMFRNGLTVRAAFGESMALIRRHPGSTALFIVLRVALFIALVILSVLACCFTCCLAMLPYFGTVVLLPALIYIRCFSLDCLAQFGPTYDVWTVDVRPEAAPSPFSPPPPLG